jgi:hypothetical protein
MRQPQNFRLRSNTVATIQLLAEESNTTRTNIVERAIDAYAKYKSAKKRELLSYAGCMDAKEMDEILDIIYKSRRNKDIRVYL